MYLVHPLYEKAHYKEDIASAKVVGLDPFFGEDAVQVAKWCDELTRCASSKNLKTSTNVLSYICSIQI